MKENGLHLVLTESMAALIAKFLEVISALQVKHAKMAYVLVVL